MKPLIKHFVKICSQSLPLLQPIYEFGSFQVKGQEGRADLRPMFPGKKYVGADIRSGPGVDVVLDLHKIALPPKSVGTVFCLETLEHVEFPRKAIKEIQRILKPKGIAIISSQMKFPIHDHPFDFWRFTPEAFKSLLKPFDCSFVGFVGEKNFPHTVVAVGFKNPVPKKTMVEFTKEFKQWQKHWNNLLKIQENFKNKVKLFVPPIVLDFYRKIRGNV